MKIKTENWIFVISGQQQRSNILLIFLWVNRFTFDFELDYFQKFFEKKMVLDFVSDECSVLVV